MDEASPLRSTIVVLSAGTSPFLQEVLKAAARCKGPRDELMLVWSGHGSMPNLSMVDRIDTIMPDLFDHGGTRMRAVRALTSEYVAFLSDDATPVSPSWLETILGPFADSGVGAVFGRHGSRADAPLTDRVFREARYPAVEVPIVLAADGRLSTVAPISNANAAYRIAPLLAAGGFPTSRFAEDREAARRLLTTGWAVRYAPEAVAWHSHYHDRRQIVQRGEAAGSSDILAGGATGAAEWLRFAGRAMRSAWTFGGFRAVTSLAGAISLRAFGLAKARLKRVSR